MNFRNASERLKQQLEIHAIVGTDQRSDRRHVVKCTMPGHDDRSPSLHIDPRANTWRCYGACNAGGSVIDWVMVRDRLSYVDAVRRLADEHGIEIERPSPEEQARYEAEERRHRCLEYATAHGQSQIASSPDPLAYLLSRGFTLETIKDQRLGWAPGGTLVNAIVRDQGLKDQGITIEDFLACGLVRTNEKGHRYDFFRSRIIFPIVKAGRVVGLSGRLLGEHKPLPDGSAPKKYLNMAGPSQEVPLGVSLDLYHGDACRAPEVYVGEGLPDTVTMIQWGLNATGSPGTGGVDKHVERFAHCRSVIFCWDNDAAGLAGKVRAATRIQEGLVDGQCYFIELPAGVKDVNEWLMAGATCDDFLDLPRRSLIAWLIEQIPPAASADEKRRGLDRIWGLMAKLPPLNQEEYTRLIKLHLGVSPALTKDAVRAKVAEVKKRQATASATEGAAASLTFERRPQIVPAQDFSFTDGRCVALTTIYLEVERQHLEENGKVRRVRTMAPYLIRATRSPELRIEYLDAATMSLTDAERGRIPDAMFADRWRPERHHPYGVAAFIDGHVKSVNVPELFDDLYALFKRYIWLPDPLDYYLLAVWSMQTYVYRLFDSLGYLWLNGVRESGKSQIMRLLEEVCFNGRRAASMTGAVLYRSVEANCRTVFVDEAEQLARPAPGTPAYELMLMCNDSYKKGSRVERNDPRPGGGWAPRGYDVWAPKVFGSINEIGYVLASRCIKVQCLRATAEESASLRDFSQEHHLEVVRIESIRDRLYCFALLYAQDLHEWYTEVLRDDPGLRYLRGREREMWIPLLSIASLIDDERHPNGRPSDPGGLVTHNLMALQGRKSEQRQSQENAESLDLLFTKAAYEAVRDRAVECSYGVDGEADAYPTNALAKWISEQLLESGAVTKESLCTTFRLTAALKKVGAITQDDVVRPRVDGKKQRSLRLQLDTLAAAVRRLGGNPDD